MGKKGGREFFEAAEWGKTERVQELLDQGTDPNSIDPEEEPVLLIASMKGNLGVVKALVAAKADVNAKNDVGFTALMVAARGGRASTVKELVTAGADRELKNMQGETALQMASNESKTEC